MCFAALAASKLRDLEREFAAFIDAAEFAEKFWLRVGDPKSGVRFPVDINRAFLQPPRNDAEASAKEAIDRCPIYLTRETAEAWLSPEARQRRI